MRIETQEAAQAAEEDPQCLTMQETGGMHGLDTGNVGAVDTKPQLSPAPATSGAGGRLKFYKDGRLLFELAHAREGDRMAWYSVPRKTYFPPLATSNATPGTPTPPTPKQESMSDDNSSLQSSPWQRDHSWKQTTPSRKNFISPEITFYFHAPSFMRGNRNHAKIVKLIRRRPFQMIYESQEFKSFNNNQVQLTKTKQIARRTDVKQDKLNNIISFLIKFRQNKKIWPIVGENVRGSGTTNAFKSHLLRYDQLSQQNAPHNMVSPRKRILREFERVMTDSNDQQKSQGAGIGTITQPNNDQKRSKPKISATSPSSTITTRVRGTVVPLNGLTDTTKMTSNYSISSLLAGGRHGNEQTPRSKNSITSSPSHRYSPSDLKKYKNKLSRSPQSNASRSSPPNQISPDRNVILATSSPGTSSCVTSPPYTQVRQQSSSHSSSTPSPVTSHQSYNSNLSPPPSGGYNSGVATSGGEEMRPRSNSFHMEDEYRRMYYRETETAVQHLNNLKVEQNTQENDVPDGEIVYHKELHDHETDRNTKSNDPITDRLQHNDNPPDAGYFIPSYLYPPAPPFVNPATVAAYYTSYRQPTFPPPFFTPGYLHYPRPLPTNPNWSHHQILASAHANNHVRSFSGLSWGPTGHDETDVPLNLSKNAT